MPYFDVSFDERDKNNIFKKWSFIGFIFFQDCCSCNQYEVALNNTDRQLLLLIN